MWLFGRRLRGPSGQHLVVDVVEGALVDELGRRLLHRSLLLLLLAPFLAPLFGHDAEVERAHLPLRLIVRTQQLVDAELGRHHGNAGAANLVAKLIHLGELDLGAEDLQPPPLQLPRHELRSVGDVLGKDIDEGGIRDDVAPRHLRAELLAQRPGEIRLFDQLQLEEVGAEASTIEHLPVERFLEPILGKQPPRDE